MKQKNLMNSIRYRSSRTGSKVDQREDFHTVKSPPTGYVTHISNPTHIPETQKKFLEIPNQKDQEKFRLVIGLMDANFCFITEFIFKIRDPSHIRNK